jgi:hypothetical protein
MHIAFIHLEPHIFLVELGTNFSRCPDPALCISGGDILRNGYKYIMFVSIWSWVTHRYPTRGYYLEILGICFGREHFAHRDFIHILVPNTRLLKLLLGK